MVGQVFTEHHVVRADNAAQSEKNAVRRAIGDKNAFRAGCHAHHAKPCSGRFAMALEPRDRPAGAHEARIVTIGHLAKNGARGIFMVIEINAADDG
ncbi:hypothetical protein D3C87_1067330 [compost metagenome]